MGRIYYLMGKSSSGKDTIYKKLMEQEEFPLKAVVPYTTRPIREGETDGVEYHFSDDRGLKKLKESGRVIELREYHTVHGIWKYFTADDGQIDLGSSDYLMIGTLVSYEKMQEYYGKEAVVPLYIEVEDGIRLQRALNREMGQEKPKYAELCRRFLADSEDFSEDNLKSAGIGRRFQNVKCEICVREILDFMKTARYSG